MYHKPEEEDTLKRKHPLKCLKCEKGREIEKGKGFTNLLHMT